VIDDLCHSCGACSYACQFGAIVEKEVCVGSINEYICANNATIMEARTRTGVFSPVPLIKAGIAQSPHSGLVLFDSPPGTSCPFIQTVARVDYVILVTEPTPFGLSDLRQSVDTLRQMNKHFGVVVNRSGIGNDEVYQYLAKEEIPLLLTIPFDKRIASEYAQGKVFAEGNPAFQTDMLKMFQTIKEGIWN
jgi:MinD superfamily P-loop ATPase